jgi:hypothetical protein
MTADLGTAIVMETTFTPGAGFSVNQCFPSFNGLFALTDAVAGLRGTAGPHQLASWRATTALNQATGVRMSAGSGPVTQPYPMEGDLFHSLESDSPRGGGLWERSGGVLDEEISLWSDGRSGARSHTTREHLQVLFTGGTMPGTALDFDAIEVDPAFAGTDAATDPSIHDFYLSITTDTVMGNPPVLVDNADVFQILENGGINKILTRAQLQAALGTTDTTIDVDAIAASKGTPASETLLYLSMWRSHSLSGSNPNLPATIREGDIVAVPVNPQPNSATLVYLTEEFAAITARFGHTMGPNVTNVSIDPNGNPSRPNPNPGGGTRPDVLFNDNLVPTHLKHIYSTRASSGTDGVIVRHQLTMGYGNVAGTAPIVIDALAAFPGATPSPTAEGAAALVGGQNFASFVARFHGARATVVWAVGISRLSPGVDYRPLLSHNLLCVVPDLLFTLVTDENGISELGLTGPALGFSIDVFAQAGGVYVGAGNGWALTTPFKVTWR